MGIQKVAGQNVESRKGGDLGEYVRSYARCGFFSQDSSALNGRSDSLRAPKSAIAESTHPDSVQGEIF